MIKIIDGKKMSASIKEELKAEVDKITMNDQRAPGLAVVIVGENPASKVYVNSKVKTCGILGIYSEKHNLDSETTETELLKLVRYSKGNDLIHKPPLIHVLNCLIKLLAYRPV